MGLFDRIKWFGGDNDGLSPAMRMALRSKDREVVRKMMIDLQLETERFTKQDITAWRAAWQLAIDHESPRRKRLYDIYTDVSIDMHLTGCIGQRKGMAMRRAYKLVDRSGKEDRAATELLRQEWFDEFVSLVLDSRYWGHSLIELGDVVRVGDVVRYDRVSLVPRVHVVPERGVLLRTVNDELRQGVPYREGALAEWCVEVGGWHDLGLLLKCAPSALSKKNMLAFWDGFGEVFGMPIRIAKTTSRDESERGRLFKMLGDMGANFFGVFSEGTDIEIKETTRGDAFNVYDKRIDRANSELSKGVLNQTMTIDSGASLSQSEVHLEVFENVVAQDQALIRNTVNNRLLPRMVAHGFPVEGYRFDWDDALQLSPEQQLSMEQMLLSNYEVDPKYFADKYRIPVVEAKRQPTNSLRSFFD